MTRKLVDVVTGVNKERILAIDHSSTSIAFTLMVDSKPEIWGKALYWRKSNLNDKFRMMPGLLDLILGTTNPTHIAIEQAIYVQNPNTARVLAGINGGLMCLLANRGFDAQEVRPSEWKNYHGDIKINNRLDHFKYMTAKEKTVFKKSQIADKAMKMWPWFNPNDFDISDSCGIAAYAAGICLKEVM